MGSWAKRVVRSGKIPTERSSPAQMQGTHDEGKVVVPTLSELMGLERCGSVSLNVVVWPGGMICLLGFAYFKLFLKKKIFYVR